MIKRILTAILALVMLFGMTANAYDQVYTKTYFENDAEEAFQEVSMLSLDSTAMIINGAVRYIDDDNLKLTPKLYEARTYLPLESLEMLYKIYTNDTENDINISLRDYGFSESTRIILTGDNAEINGVSKENEYLIYVDSEPYVALRAVGEIIGKTVLYNNGYILIGEESYVNIVNENEEYFNYGKAILDSFNPETQGNTYYASASAFGGGNGTLENPYTLSEASSIAKAGDTVYLRGGIYRETLTPGNCGTPSKPIIYKAYNNEKVVISALEEITSDYTEENGLLTTSVTSIGDGRDQIFYNGEALIEARFPNVNNDDYTATDVSPWFLTKGDLTVNADDSTTTDFDEKYKVTSESGLLSGDEEGKWVGAKFISLHGGAYCTGTAVVKESGDGYFIVDENTVTKKWWFSYDPDNSMNDYRAGYLTGHINCIDTPKEWVVKNNTLYIKAPEGETSDSLNLEIKARQLAINLKDKKYIHIDGIDTIGGGINLNNSEMCVLKNCEFKYISHYTMATDHREGYFDSDWSGKYVNMYFEDGAPRRGEMGIYISGKNDVVRDCKIDTSAGAGLYMTGIYTLVKNNEILNTGYRGSNVSGIFIGADAQRELGVDADDKDNADGTDTDYTDEDSSIPRGGYVITNNKVRNAGRGALMLLPPEQSWVTGNCKCQAAYIPMEIAYNRFENGAISARDAGVVYFWGATLGNDVRNTRFHHNSVSLDCNVPNDKLHSFIYFDNYTNKGECFDNLIFKDSSSTTIWNEVFVQNAVKAPAEILSDIVNGETDYLIANSVENIAETNYPDGEYFHTGLK